MALQLSQTCTCDWHAVLPEPANVTATAERLNPKGTLNDLCDSCALLFDLIFPRLDALLPFLHPDTLQALVFMGRTVGGAEKPQRPSGQLALPGQTSPPKPAKKASKKKASAPNGARQAGVEQVICPEQHRQDSAKPYWVDVSKRNSHARSSHHVTGPEIAYELPPGLAYEVFCMEHALCVKAGGYGFLDEQTRQSHYGKCKHWDPAPK